jgi:hypothetical protein
VPHYFWEDSELTSFLVFCSLNTKNEVNWPSSPLPKKSNQTKLNLILIVQRKPNLVPFVIIQQNYQIEFEAISDEGVHNKIILSPKLCPLSTSWSYLFSCAHRIFFNNIVSDQRVAIISLQQNGGGGYTLNYYFSFKKKIMLTRNKGTQSPHKIPMWILLSLGLEKLGYLGILLNGGYGWSTLYYWVHK